MFLNLEDFDDVEYASTVKCDNEDEINSDNTCWHCDNTSDVSVV